MALYNLLHSGVPRPLRCVNQNSILPGTIVYKIFHALDLSPSSRPFQSALPIAELVIQTLTLYQILYYLHIPIFAGQVQRTVPKPIFPINNMTRVHSASGERCHIIIDNFFNSDQVFLCASRCRVTLNLSDPKIICSIGELTPDVSFPHLIYRA
jgi:hypothetical protein